MCFGRVEKLAPDHVHRVAASSAMANVAGSSLASCAGPSSETCASPSVPPPRRPGRPRKTGEEKALTNAARTERQRCRRRADAELRAREAAAKRRKRSLASQTTDLDPDGQKLNSERQVRLARQAEAQRQRRQEDPALREREAELKRRRRQEDPALREQQAEAKRLKRQAEAQQRARNRATVMEQHTRRCAAAANMFEERFIKNPFGFSCSACDGFVVCRICIKSIRRDRIQNFATTNGYG